MAYINAMVIPKKALTGLQAFMLRADNKIDAKGEKL